MPRKGLVALGGDAVIESVTVVFMTRQGFQCMVPIRAVPPQLLHEIIRLVFSVCMSGDAIVCHTVAHFCIVVGAQVVCACLKIAFYGKYKAIGQVDICVCCHLQRIALLPVGIEQVLPNDIPVLVDVACEYSVALFVYIQALVLLPAPVAVKAVRAVGIVQVNGINGCHIAANVEYIDQTVGAGAVGNV